MNGRKKLFSMVAIAAIVIIVALLIARASHKAARKLEVVGEEKPPPPPPTEPEKPAKRPVEEEKKPPAAEPEEAEREKKEAGEKKTAFDYRTYRELKSVRAQLSLLGLSKETLNDLMYALEIFMSGDYEGGLGMMESLFAGANAQEKPQLGMILIQQYLNFGKINRAEKIARSLKTEFSETAFPHLARAYIDMLNDRVTPAFQSMEKVFELGKNDNRLFLWYSLFGMLQGSEAQAKKIDDWFMQYHKLHPGNAVLLFSAFNYYATRQRPDDALSAFREFQKVCQDKELLTTALNRLAWNYYSLGEVKKGMESLNQAIELNPEDPWPQVSLAYYLSFTGSVDQAEHHLNNALDLIEGTAMKAEIYRMLAETYRKQGDREKMLAANQQALRLNPAAPGNFLSLAESYAYLGELDQAIEICHQGLALKDEIGINPWTLSRLYNQLATIYDQKKEPEKCLENLEKAAGAQIGYSQDAYRNFFTKYRKYKSEGATIEKAKELIQKHPDDPYLHGTIAGFYRQWGRYDEAIQSFQKAIELSDKDNFKLRYLNSLAGIYFNKKEPEKAGELAEKAVTDFPYNYRSYQNLGSVYQKMEEYEKALREYRTAFDLAGPGWHKVQPLKQMALIYDKLGDTGKAIESYQTMAELMPSEWTASQLAGCYEKKRMTEEAVQAYRTAIKLCRETGQLGGYYQKIANIQLNQEKKTDAVKTMKDYVAAFPEDPASHFHLGTVYRRIEDYGSAEAAYRKAIELSGGNIRQKLMYMDRLVGMLTKEANEQNEAIGMAKEMIELAPDYGKGYERLADIYVSQESFEAAAKTYETIAERAGGPENWRFARYTRRAAINYAKGGWENRALSLARNALQKAPDNYELNQNMGDVYRQCRHYSDALGSYEKTLELAPEGKKEGIRKRTDELKKEMREQRKVVEQDEK